MRKEFAQRPYGNDERSFAFVVQQELMMWSNQQLINFRIQFKAKVISLMGMDRKMRIQELWFQLILILSLLPLFLLEFEHDEILVDWKRAPFYFTYVLASMLINYWLLPKFFYAKKYVQFAVGFVVIVAGVIVCEELVLEKIIYPDTRGRSFPGVLFTLIEVTPVVLILSGAKFAWDAHRKVSEVNRLKELVVDSELQLLRSQVSPHFLFNNMNNLYAHAVEQSPDTPGIILELSAMLRYMLYDCREPSVLLGKEIDHLNNYIRLNQLHVGERGKVHFDTNGVDESLLIAPMILIVFVENTFKHSLSSMTEGIEIDIRIRTEGNRLIFWCENRFDELTNTDSLVKGIGLENVKSRLKLLYEGRHRLKISSQAPKFLVELEIDLET